MAEPYSDSFIIKVILFRYLIVLGSNRGISLIIYANRVYVATQYTL